MKIPKWFVGILVTTFVSAFVAKLFEQGFEDIDLIAGLKAVPSTLWGWTKWLAGVLYWLSRQWAFAFSLGMASMLFIQRLVNRYKENNSNNSHASKYRYPEWQERDNIVTILSNMAMWAEYGFSPRGIKLSYDETPIQWFVKREVEIESLIDALKSIGIFLPANMERLSRGEVFHEAITVYTRLATYVKMNKIAKARKEYPAVNLDASE